MAGTLPRLPSDPPRPADQTDDPLAPGYVPPPTPVTTPGLLDQHRGRNVLGGMTATQDFQAQTLADQESFEDLTGRGFNSLNAAVGLMDWAERNSMMGPKAVPGYRISDHPELYQDLPAQFWDSFDGVSGPEEARMVRAQMLEELQDLQVLGRRGLTGFAAMAIAGILDVDLPLTLFSGGLSKGATTGLRGATAFARAGALSGFLVEGANTVVRPTGDWRNVPMAVLAGGALGGVFDGASALVKRRNLNVQDLQTEFADAMRDGNVRAEVDMRNETFTDTNPYGAREQAEVLDDAAAAAMAQPGKTSVGSTQSSKLDMDTEDISAEGVQMIEGAQDFLRNEGITSKLEIEYADTALGRAAEAFQRILAKTPLVRTDYDKLVTSGSSVATKMAYDLFESAAGIVRNNRSAAMIDDMYSKRLLSDFLPEYDNAYKEWAKDKGVDVMDTVWHGRGREEFSRELALELQTRYHEGAGMPGQHPAITRAADAHDRGTARAIDYMHGKPAETAVHGSENIQAKTGYMRQVWSGRAIQKMIDEGGKSSKQIKNIIARAYQQSHPGLSGKDALVMASAVVRRARSKQSGIDSNLAMLLDADGREFMHQALRDNGLSPKEANRIIEAFRGPTEERGRAGFTKRRNDIDLRSTIDGVQLIDLVDHNMPRVYSRYARGVAGQSALARKGIASRADRTRIIDTILQERQGRGHGADNHDYREFLEGMFSYFDGGPIGGGVNPWVNRAKRVTNLSLLNQLGMTQLGETGAIIATAGMENFLHSIRREWAGLKSGKKPEVLEELSAWSGNLGEEHKLFRDDLALDYVRDDVGANSELARMADDLLARGQRVQGYTSGFYKIRQIQQRLAVTTITDKIFRGLKGNRAEMSPERLYDIGLSKEVVADIQKYATDGTVEFDPSGFVNRLNMDKWSDATAEEFALAINRHTNQVVQRPVAGEGFMWMHKDVGAILGHLKSFPMTSVQKQFIRNARLADPENKMLWMYGLGTAGLAYSVRQLINGKTDNLTPTSIASGAINYSNVAGWIPMWYDPLASLLGQDDLRFNNYRHGADQGVLPSIPALSTLNRVAHVPAGVMGLLPGAEFTNNDIRALQATPLIGNAYGFNLLFNALKD